VFPVRYELSSYVLIRSNLVFKDLMLYQLHVITEVTVCNIHRTVGSQPLRQFKKTNFYFFSGYTKLQLRMDGSQMNTNLEKAWKGSVVA
jgi:hypothetical protein